jgi:hypothetical protein
VILGEYWGSSCLPDARLPCVVQAFCEVDQDFADVSEQFAYESIGGESTAAIPVET